MNRGVTGSVVKLGLIPEVKPLMDIQMRDTVIRGGGDGMYYLTGSTGEDIWDHKPEGPYVNALANDGRLDGDIDASLFEDDDGTVYLVYGGGTDYLQDKQGNWWDCFFGNDNQAPFREKPAMVAIEFDKDGKIHPVKR